MPITKAKNMHKFKDSEKYLNYRAKIVNKFRGGFDDSHIDKAFLKKLEGVYFCKWCGKPMYPADYDRRQGSIIMSCRKQFCPGNIDSQARFKVNPKDWDIRKQVNTWMFSKRMKLDPL